MTYHKSDFSGPSLAGLFSTSKPDLIVCTVSGGSFEAQKRIIDCAYHAGVPRYISPEFGQDSLNPSIEDRLPPSRERARTIEYLQQLEYLGGISWVAVATGSTLDHGILSGKMGFDMKWQSATLHGKGHERFAASSSAWIGQVVLAVIRQWSDLQNQYLYAASMITCANDIVQCFEKDTGKKFEVGRAEMDECVREAERRIDRGFPDAGMFLMERSVLYDESLAAVRPFEDDDDDAKGKLGLEGERLEDVIKGIVHEYEHHGGNADCGCG